MFDGVLNMSLEAHKFCKSFCFQKSTDQTFPENLIAFYGKCHLELTPEKIFLQRKDDLSFTHESLHSCVSSIMCVS